MPTLVEKYPAIVSRNEDPDNPKLGRVFVTCESLTGDPDTELPDSIEPVHDWGWFYVPDIGEEIEIECVVEDDQKEDTYAQAFLENPQLRWRGKRFISAQGKEPRPINEFFTWKNYGKRRGFYTPAGHVLFFDDTDNDRSFSIAWKKENTGTAYSQMTIDKHGSVLMLTHNSMMLHLNAEDSKEGITLLDKHGNMVALNKNGVVINDKHSNIVTLKDGAVQIVGAGDINAQAGANVVINSGGIQNKAKISLLAEGDVDLNCTNVNLRATGEYKLGDGADTALVRWAELKEWLNAHNHPTAFGPSGTPIVPVTDAPASTKGSLI